MTTTRLFNAKSMTSFGFFWGMRIQSFDQQRLPGQHSLVEQNMEFLYRKTELNQLSKISIFDQSLLVEIVFGCFCLCEFSQLKQLTLRILFSF